MKTNPQNKKFWWSLITLLVVIISICHYITPTTEAHFHLIYMQSYFIPILIAAFQLGVRGGVITAMVISIVYVPHVMFQWSGHTDHTLLRLLQIIMYNVIGYLTGLKAQKVINEKKRYQQTALQLEQSLEKLEQRSNELADLEEQLRLSDRMAIVGELTASLAHELRNPLGTIRGTVEILNDELPEEIKNREFFNILIQETERMSAVTEHYLNFASKQKNPDSEYDVREIVHNICLVLGSRATKDQISIHAKLQDQPLILKGDPNDLRQILVNLLLNAIEAMSPGGEIRITSQLNPTDNASLDSPEREDDNPVLRLSIKDQGTGIELENVNKIFKPFYTTKKNGTGLGLSIVKRIADNRHWKIEVNSQPNQGTEFFITVQLEAVDSNFRNSSPRKITE